ncbi:family 43 glycosylhydrolase [Pseudarthrobacter sp. DSP2-3-2b1]|uniref:family 43 glycosylhydrolase n=1 Tax=Pseudarthrobacter sp. DSP2-3-2b1 TaxID=2804661 RepID=UPI003CF00D8A
MSNYIVNPVLPGFFPDPSIVRVGEWYYIANSSFEWFPAIPIHRSRDLMTWQFAGSLQGPDVRFDFSGIQDSGGIWAPSLSWDEGTFWLTFSVVHSFGGNHKDMDTFVSRAVDVAGPWSRPARVTTTGFDPSIFHHEGKHWLLNMEWDHRPGVTSGFAGLTLQELNAEGTDTIGAPRNILRPATLTEGPNVYYRDCWYYLMVAEGGTGFNHGILMYRSRELNGPYEADPSGALLTSRDDRSLFLQKSGHGEIVLTAEGEPYLVHLASRVLENVEERRAVLGRETCLQQLTWEPDQWPRLAQGGHHPAQQIMSPAHGLGILPEGTDADCYEASSLPGSQKNLAWPWSTLRESGPSTHEHAEWFSTTARPGWVRLRGRRSTDSLRDQSLIAQRIISPCTSVEVTVDATPANYTQSAGLIIYYNTSAYFYLRLSARNTEHPERILELWERDRLQGLRIHALATVRPEGPLGLKVQLADGKLQFQWWQGRAHPVGMGPALDFSRLSDDYANQLNFTGPFVGVCAQDLRDQSFLADFREFVTSASMRVPFD